MKYALGNMLNGAGGLNPDGLSLDLQFATDKTLTARKGPTPLFTRGSTATFIGSNGLIQSAAVDAARFDHDPITLACNGLLIEESRTNQCYNSNLLTSASWSISNASIATSDTAPDGSAAFEITETAVTGFHSIGNSGGATTTPSTSITSGFTYTLSFFAKKSTGSVDWIQLIGTGAQFGTAQYANFNLATGAIGNYAGVTSGTIPKMEQFPNGWYRCSMTLTATATGLGYAIPVHLINNTNTTTRAPSYIGSTANKVKVAMAQFEAGSFATSYIPTTSSALTRSADVCRISGSNFTGMYNQTEGAMLVNAFTPARGIRNIVSSYLAGFNKGITLLTNVSAAELEVNDGGSQVDMSSGSPISPNTAFKLACAYKLNDFALTKNNVTPQTDTSGTVPTVDTMRVGSGPGGNTMCGCISSLTYYKKRLSDAKIQALTAP